MKITYLVLLFLAVKLNCAQAQVKILFDATKGETAGNADWVIDADAFNLNFSNGPATIGGGNEANAQRYPSPLQSNISANTAENYWKGGISYWGIDCVKKGYQVETLPYNGIISYGNTTNNQDLSYYNIYVVVEPNIVFSASEKTAIINFVKNGGSLFIVSDHDGSDRNNDNWDSRAIWNDLFTNNGQQNNPFGIAFDLVTYSGSSTNVSTVASDSLIQGNNGQVTQVLWSSGTTITINKTANPTVQAAVFKNGASQNGSTNILAAYARYGAGKVVAVGDSSPFDDGTGDLNDQLYDGYITDAGGNHRKLILNATDWLAKVSVLPVKVISFAATENKGAKLLKWEIGSQSNVSYYNIQKSEDGKKFFSIGQVKARDGISKYDFTDNQMPNNKNNFYRLQIVDNDGKLSYSEIISIHATPHFSLFTYPNPCRNQLTIEASDFQKLMLLDGQGNLLLAPNLTGANLIKVNMGGFPSGFYTLKAVDRNGNSTIQKVIKN